MQERVLALIVDKTGYPREMLDLDLDLEADLGIDTVKQAEVFAAIRETYNIPRDPNLKLRDFPTLARVIQFVYDRRPDLKAAAPVAVPAAKDTVQQKLLDLITEKTGYPQDMLELDLDLEGDLGIDTVKQVEVFAAIRETYNIPRDPNLKLRDFPTLARVIQFVYDRRPDLKAAAPVAVPAAKDTVQQKLLDLITEKTGYPKDMLDLDLDLEADLGIDTVKQAEVFAAIRETYNIPRDPNLKLRDFPTLARVIQFVYDRRPDLKAAAPPVPASTDDAIRDAVLDIVAEKSGYPKDMLDLDLDLEADLGIDTVKQAEMFASVRATFDIPRDQNLRLRDFPTLAHVIRFARERGVAQPAPAVVMAEATFEAAAAIPRRVPIPALRPPLAMCKPTGVSLASGRRVFVMPDRSGVAQALVERLQSLGVEVVPSADVPVHGVYWLPALDDEGDLRQITPAAWREAVGSPPQIPLQDHARAL